MARPEPVSAFYALRGAGPKGPATVTNGVFDMVISLYNNPAGDDDGNTQGMPGSESQDAYEYIIQYFADAVFESTEGKHSIGRVRIYRNGQQSEADVIWTRSGGPASAGHLNNEGKVGFIEFYDIFNANDFTNNMTLHEKGGYTLAHEWGHYAYGLLDEYCVKSQAHGGWSNLAATNRVQPSIMNHQWSAAGRNYEWLNFSIPNQGHTIDADFAPYENRRQSAHHQAYEQSCWETLSTNSANDPANTPYQNTWRGHYGTRVHYPELATVAPAGTNPPRIDLSSTDNPASLPSRRELNIIWMSTNVAVELMIDRSGSMLDTLDQAKAAAKALLDQAPTGTAVGIVSFSITPTVQSPIMVISNETIRTQLKTAVDNIPGVDLESGYTAIGDAAAHGLFELLAFSQSNITCASFIISDGENNYGTDPLDVIPEYQRANVPIMGISIGELTECLRVMPEETGGRAYLSADGQLSSLSSAMREALTLASGRKSLGQGKYIFDDLVAFSGNRVAARSYSIPVVVDSSLNDLKVSVTYSNAVTVSLKNPDGSSCAPVLTNATRLETQLFYNVYSPAAGEWRITGTMNENSSMKYTVDSGISCMTYHLRAWSMPSPNVTYVHFPYPLEIYAHLQKERPINGAVVTANLYFQYPTLTSNIDITLTSIGNGCYWGTIPNPYWADYQITVRADNSAGTAYMTSEGILPAPLPDGTIPDPEPDMLISENFVRYDTYYIEAVGCDANEEAPRAPIYVNATAGTFDDCVRLRWYDMNLNFRHIAQYFEVWRSTDPQMAGAIKIGQATYPESQYFDTNVVQGTIYYYAVRATNPVRSSEFAPKCMGYAAGQGALSPWVPLAADFDGDRKADPAVYQPMTGAWKLWSSGSNYGSMILPAGFLGGKGYDAVAADFDGDGLADPAVYGQQTGDWIVRLSSAGYAVSVFPGLLGNSSWVAVAGDWDGDRLADPSLFCDATGEMKTRLSSAGYASFSQQMFYWDAGLIPLGADWDGDRFYDPAVCEVPTAYWEIKLSGSTYNGIPIAQLWNYLIRAGSLPVAADFDGDGFADPCSYNVSSGLWQVNLSSFGYATTSVLLP